MHAGILEMSLWHRDPKPTAVARTTRQHIWMSRYMCIWVSGYKLTGYVYVYIYIYMVIDLPILIYIHIKTLRYMDGYAVAWIYRYIDMKIH